MYAITFNFDEIMLSRANNMNVCGKRVFPFKKNEHFDLSIKFCSAFSAILETILQLI